MRSNYLWDEAALLYEHGMKLWEGLTEDLNFNVMFSQRGVFNLGHTLQDMRDIERRVNANRLQGVDAHVLTTAEVAEKIRSSTAAGAAAIRCWARAGSRARASRTMTRWRGDSRGRPAAWAWT